MKLLRQSENVTRILDEVRNRPELLPHIYCKRGRWDVRFPPPLELYNGSSSRYPRTFKDACSWARHIHISERRKARDQKRSPKTRWLSE